MKKYKITIANGDYPLSRTNGKPASIYDAPENHIGDITITLTERERDYLTECIARVLEGEPRPLKLVKLLNKIAGLNDPGTCGQTKSE